MNKSKQLGYTFGHTWLSGVDTQFNKPIIEKIYDIYDIIYNPLDAVGNIKASLKTHLNDYFNKPIH